MTARAPFLGPTPLLGDVLYIPCLGAMSVQVTRITDTHVTLLEFGRPTRRVVKRWRIWWFRFRCRRARLLCNTAPCGVSPP